MNFNALDISATALSAQRLRMDVISGNLANADTTRRPDGTLGAYRRKRVVFNPVAQNAMQNMAPGSNRSFQPGLSLSNTVPVINQAPDGSLFIKAGVSYNAGANSGGVEVAQITDAGENATKLVYDPGHPDANKEGYVEKPNINIVTKMVNIISDKRDYEASLTSVANYKSMMKQTLQM